MGRGMSTLSPLDPPSVRPWGHVASPATKAAADALPGHQALGDVHVDGVQRDVVHGGRGVDDDVHLTVERRVTGPQERDDAHTVRVRHDGGRQPDVRCPGTGVQLIVVHAPDLVQDRLGGPERAAHAAADTVKLPARARMEEKEQAQGAQEDDERER